MSRPNGQQCNQKHKHGKDARSTGNRHDTRLLGDNLGVRKHKRERESCYNNRRGDEAAEVDWSRALIVGGEVVASAVREHSIWQWCEDKRES